MIIVLVLSCIIHSDSEDASSYIGITFTVFLTIPIIIAAMLMVVVALICKRFVPLSSSV